MKCMFTIKEFKIKNECKYYFVINILQEAFAFENLLLLCLWILDLYSTQNK